MLWAQRPPISRAATGRPSGSMAALGTEGGSLSGGGRLSVAGEIEGNGLLGALEFLDGLLFEGDELGYRLLIHKANLGAVCPCRDGSGRVGLDGGLGVEAVEAGGGREGRQPEDEGSILLEGGGWGLACA